MKKLTVGDLRKALEGVPGDVVVELGGDVGMDPENGEIVVETAYRMKCDNIDYFVIYANDYEGIEV